MRKTISAPRGDVPSGIVAGLIVYLVAVLAPLAMVTPDLPSTLPPLSYDSAAIVAGHSHPAARAVPRFVDESYLPVLRAAAVRDRSAQARAQQDFAAMVIDAAGDDVSIRRAIREHHLRLFLDAVANGTDDPSVALAERHRLAGGNSGAGVDEAVQIAWFDASWERFAARESLRGDPLDLEQIAARIPPQEARALTAWALEVECDALLGAPAGHRFTPSDWEQCALVREQYVGLARVLDAGYPVDRARADVDALLGRDLEGSGASDEERAAAHTSAHEAFSRAHAMYTALAEHEPSRLLRRYVWGTQQHLGD